MNSLIKIVIDRAFNSYAKCNCPCHKGIVMFEYLPCCTPHPILDNEQDEWPLKAIYNTVWHPRDNKWTV